MKTRHILIACFALLFSNLTAQTSISNQLNWKGIERWHANDSVYIDVFTFDGAHQTGTLPYFSHSVALDGSHLYTATIENAVYIPLETDELAFLQDISLSEQARVETHISSSRGNRWFNVSVFPFAKQDGEILKLKSFDLVLEQSLQTENLLRSSVSRTYPQNSVLANGDFIKVRITESGIYRISHTELRNRGLDPNNVRMFGFGGAKLNEDSNAPYTSDLPEIAIYQTNNEILFYAQGIDKWTYSAAIEMFTHTRNPYSQHGYYFITSDNIGTRKRIQEREVNPGGATVNNVTQFTDYQVHELELHTMIRSGRAIFGERFTNGTSRNLPTFSFPNIVQTEPVRTRIHVVNSIVENTRNAVIFFNLTLAGNSRPISLPANSQTASPQHTFTPSSDNLTFNLQYSGSANGFLNYLTVNAQRRLIMTGAVMPFHNRLNIGANSYNRYTLETGGRNIQIWDVSDNANVRQMSVTRTNTNLSFIDAASQVKSYVAIDMGNVASIPQATLVQGTVPNQNIHGIGHIDYLIITHPLFLTAAEDLAEAHREINGLRVAVVTTEQVYNEFSSGTPDATAYRWAAKMFYDRAVQSGVEPLRYLLLFGKGSFDNRGILPSSGYNLVMTYQSVDSWSDSSYVTDDYFALMEDGKGRPGWESRDNLDIAVGRFPVTTLAEAEGVVDKTIRYMRNENNGGWKNQLTFISDKERQSPPDDNRDRREGFLPDIDRIANRVSSINPSYHANKIFLDAHNRETNASGVRFPDAVNRFQNLLRSGTLFVCYLGHAGPNNWSEAQIFSVRDINALRNRHLPLFAAGTCNFSQFDDHYTSGGEAIVLNPLGGGIGSFSATRVVFSSSNTELMQRFADALFSNNTSIGQAVMKAKNAASLGTHNNRLKYVYFGCPAVRLQQPNQYRILTTSINGDTIDRSTVVGMDTLRALSRNTIKGTIVDSNGNKVSHFNGIVQIVVFDKEEEITTLVNNRRFRDRPNTLFRGTAEVKNGEFNFTFIVPRSIRYNYGTGRMIFNAWSSERNSENVFEEAQGHCEHFYIGGSDDTVTLATIGPNVRMYLNHPNFVSGDRVHQTPIFTAHVSDIHGINTSSPAPGHDIMLRIGNHSFPLNDHYQARLGSYQEGTVNFQLPELLEGRHTLMFRVWNLHNVSTVEYLDFEVVRDLRPEIFSVIAAPNPARAGDQVHIMVNHDRADEIISMTVDVYDLTGRLIWTRTQENSPIITWDTGGGRISPGIYIYRVSVMNGRRIHSSQAGRIIIR